MALIFLYLNWIPASCLLQPLDDLLLIRWIVLMVVRGMDVRISFLHLMYQQMFVLWQLEGSVPLQIFRKSWKFVPDSPPSPRVGWEPPKYKKINVPLHSKLFWAFYFFFFVSLKYSQNVGFWGSYEISSPLLIVVCVSLHLWNPRPDYPTRSGDKSPLFKNIRNRRLP